jgi:hypothetical protein
MSFLAPGWMLLAGVVSLGVVAIHLIAWQLPRVVSLPTARFVPDEPARRAARTVRLADLALLALRLAIIMAGGLALAKPVAGAQRRGTAVVIAVDRSATDGALTVSDSLGGIPRGDRAVFIVFDTVAQIVPGEAEATALVAEGAPNASMTVGLLAAIREARRLARDFESVEIAIVSSFRERVFDAATEAVRALWPDAIRYVRLAVDADAEVPARVDLAGDNDDPVVAGIRLAASNRMLRGASRVVRTVAVAADSAEADRGTAVVIWPRAERQDTGRVDGVHAGGTTALGHYVRTVLPDTGTVVARWIDGSAAAREAAHGAGCVRTVGFDVPDRGDLVLTPGFQRLAATLLAPCGAFQTSGMAADSVVAGLARPSGQAGPISVPDEDQAPNRLAAVLMALAVLLAVAEVAIRRRWFGAGRRQTPAVAT